MKALKIIAEGPVTSFRHPHFVQGVHLTFDMLPPATIYGHICSAVGDYIPVDATRFAYHFVYADKFFDYEHLHFFGKEPKMNPFRRELLFNPHLTLYISNLDLKEFFLRPRYPVALGRAQDLMTYLDVREVELQEVDQVFFADTLLPLKYAAQIGGHSFAVTMPRFIDAERRPTWDQYGVLQGIVDFPGEDALLVQGEEMPPMLVDPEPDAAHPSRPLQRGVIWHDWG